MASGGPHRAGRCASSDRPSPPRHGGGLGRARTPIGPPAPRPRAPRAALRHRAKHRNRCAPEGRPSPPRVRALEPGPSAATVIAFGEGTARRRRSSAASRAPKAAIRHQPVLSRRHGDGAGGQDALESPAPAAPCPPEDARIEGGRQVGIARARRPSSEPHRLPREAEIRASPLVPSAAVRKPRQPANSVRMVLARSPHAQLAAAQRRRRQRLPLRQRLRQPQPPRLAEGFQLQQHQMRPRPVLAPRGSGLRPPQTPAAPPRHRAWIAKLASGAEARGSSAGRVPRRHGGARAAPALRRTISTSARPPTTPIAASCARTPARCRGFPAHCAARTGHLPDRDGRHATGRGRRAVEARLRRTCQSARHPEAAAPAAPARFAHPPQPG